MTNNVQGFDIGGVKGVIDTNTVIKRLTFSSTSTAAASYHTLLDHASGAAYQVPASKKTRIVYFVNHQPVGNGDIIYADNADGNTNPVNMYAPNDGVTKTNFIFVSTAAPATKYINFYRTNAAGTKAVDLYAIEEAA